MTKNIQMWRLPSQRVHYLRHLSEKTDPISFHDAKRAHAKRDHPNTETSIKCTGEGFFLPGLAEHLYIRP